jgi:hypothetical protein
MKNKVSSITRPNTKRSSESGKSVREKFGIGKAGEVVVKESPKYIVVDGVPCRMKDGNLVPLSRVVK